MKVSLCVDYLLLNIHTVIGHEKKFSFCDNIPETPCDNLPRSPPRHTISMRHPASHSVCKHTVDISQDYDYVVLRTPVLGSFTCSGHGIPA